MVSAAPQPDLFPPPDTRTRVELFHTIRDGKTAWFAASVETTPTGRPKIEDGRIAWACGLEGPFPSSDQARRAVESRGRKP